MLQIQTKKHFSTFCSNSFGFLTLLSHFDPNLKVFLTCTFYHVIIGTFYFLILLRSNLRSFWYEMKVWLRKMSHIFSTTPNRRTFFYILIKFPYLSKLIWSLLYKFWAFFTFKWLQTVSRYRFFFFNKIHTNKTFNTLKFLVLWIFWDPNLECFLACTENFVYISQHRDIF